jgi:hypothetical protein
MTHGKSAELIQVWQVRTYGRGYSFLRSENEPLRARRKNKNLGELRVLRVKKNEKA